MDTLWLPEGSEKLWKNLGQCANLSGRLRNKIPTGRDSRRAIRVSIRLRGQPMEQRNVTHFRWNDMPKETVSDNLDRRLITGDRMMLAHVYLKKGCIVPRHSHENEQITYILEGGLRFWIGADESQV